MLKGNYADHAKINATASYLQLNDRHPQDVYAIVPFLITNENNNVSNGLFFGISVSGRLRVASGIT